MKSLSVFPMELPVAHWLHVIGTGSPLGIDIEHQKTIIAVGQGNALYGLQCGVQGIRRGGGGIEAYTWKGLYTG